MSKKYPALYTTSTKGTFFKHCSINKTIYFELLMNEEGLTDTENKLIHIGKPIELDEEKFMQQLEELKEYVVTEPEDIRECVKKIVPTYHPELAGENK